MDLLGLGWGNTKLNKEEKSLYIWKSEISAQRWHRFLVNRMRLPLKEIRGGVTLWR